MLPLDSYASREGGESVRPWLVAAVLAAAGVLAGVAYLLSRPSRSLSVLTRAHASDGMLLTTSCSCPDEEIYEIAVRNTASGVITSHSQVEITEGKSVSNEVSSTVSLVAREVCLHIIVRDGDFASVPEYTDGTTAGHVRIDRELVLFLGDMQPCAEVRVRVRVCAGS